MTGPETVAVGDPSSPRGTTSTIGGRSAFRAGWQIFAVVALVTLLLAIVGGFLQVRNEHDARNRTVEATHGSAEAAARSADRVLLDSLGLLNLVAGSPAINSATPDQVQLVLDAVDTASAGFTGGVAWLDAEGRFLAGKDGAAQAVGTRMHDSPAFQAVVVDGQERYVGPAEQFDGGPPVVPVAVPVPGEQGDVTGVVIGYFDVGRVAQYLAGFQFGGSEVLVLDSADRLVVDGVNPGDLSNSSDDPVVRDFRDGSTSVLGATDSIGRTDRLIVAATAQTGQWLVMLSRSDEEAFGADRRSLIQDLVGLGLAASMAIAIGLFGARRIHDLQIRTDAAAAAERRGRDRATALRLAMADVAGSETRQDAAQAVVSTGAAALGATAAAVLLREDESPDTLRILASHGHPTDVVAEYDQQPVSYRTLSARAVATGRPMFVDAVNLEADYPEIAPVLLPRGDRSWAALPLRVDREVVGALSFAFADLAATEPEHQLEMLSYANEVGAAIGQARAREVEHEFALTLQRNLLPDVLPTRPDLQVDAEYLAANDVLDVGGDWYDVVERTDGATMVVVGDVVGHGVRSIAAMGQLSSVCRAVADETTPAQLIGYLERLAESVRGAAGTTAACVLIDADRQRARYAIAGHPRPLLFQQGVVTELSDNASLPLAYADVAREDAEVVLHLPATLVLFSDGLVERRDVDYAERIDTLSETIRTTPPDQLRATIVERMVGPVAGQDDTVVVVVHLPATP